MDEDKNRDIFGFRLRPTDTEHDDGGDDSRLADGGHGDSFSRFMFGGSRESEPLTDKKNTSTRFLSHVDFDEVMNHVDTLISSAKELKPLFGKVRPYLDQFIAKNKS